MTDTEKRIITRAQCLEAQAMAQKATDWTLETMRLINVALPLATATLLKFAEAAQSYRDGLHTSRCRCKHCELLREFKGGE